MGSTALLISGVERIPDANSRPAAVCARGRGTPWPPAQCDCTADPALRLSPNPCRGARDPRGQRSLGAT